MTADIYRRELAWFEEMFPCDGLCSTNGGAEEDCSRHGRKPKDLWRIIDEVREQRDSALTEVERLTAEVKMLRDANYKRRHRSDGMQVMQAVIPVRELLGCADDGTEADQ